jgi:hypothetical protein
VEVLGRYSNLCDQEKRVRKVLEIVPDGPPKVNARSPKQHQRRLTAPEIQKLKLAYKSGATLRDLAKEFQIHRTTAAEVLERAGIARRGNGPSDSEVREAIRLYGEGKSTAVIGVSLGFSADTIRQHLLRAGVRIRGPHEWQRKNR